MTIELGFVRIATASASMTRGHSIQTRRLRPLDFRLLDNSTLEMSPRFLGFIQRKRVTNCLWRISTFYILAEGVVHDRNNGIFIRSKKSHT